MLLLRRAHEQLLFLLLVVCELTLNIALTAEHRVAAAHDGYQYFTMQYYFLNGAAMAGEAPQWMPFMTHGTVATWWFAIQASLFQLLLLPIAPLLRDANFLALYHAGIFVDELVLLVGVWLLGRRFFQSPLATFFVAASVLGANIWIIQPWYNFHFYFAVPLILHLGHRYIETGRWRYLLGALHLLALQTLGNLPYFVPVTTFVIASYFLCFLAVSPGAFTRLRTQLRLPAVGALALGGGALLLTFKLLQTGTESIRNFNEGRLPSGETPLKGFLSYAGGTGAERWAELLIGVSPSIDYTLYIGVLALPMILVALLFGWQRHRAHLMLSLGILLLFLGSSRFEALLYHCWPFMKYYRHIILAGCFAKLMLCFTAGIGLDLLLRRERWARAVALAANVLLMVVLGAASLQAGRVAAFAQGLVKDDLGHYRSLLQAEQIHDALQRGVVITGVAPLLLLLAGRPRWNLSLPRCVGLLLLIHTCDLYLYKQQALWLPTVTYSEEQQEQILRFQQMPYRARRGHTPYDTIERAITLTRPGRWNVATYWSTNSFLFVDDVDHADRADHWLDPLDDLMRAFLHQPLQDKRARPRLHQGWLDIPEDHPAARKIIGSSADKIQFFSAAYRGDDAQRVADRISAPDSTGGMLYVSGADLEPAPQTPREDGLALPYQVERFDANHLTVLLHAPRPAWMFYADVWHPGWRARVNGVERPVYKGNLAYKAVRLEAGQNRVELRFDLPGLRWLYRYFSLCALVWLVLLGRWVVLLSRPAP